MKRIVWKKYAGVKKSGTISIKKPAYETRTVEGPGYFVETSSSHMDRVMWLTAMVESGGKYGCALNFDGTGMTVGLHQAIAVYPKMLDDGKRKNDQGPMWRLVRDCRDNVFISAILDEMNDGWDMGVLQDGKVHYGSDLKLAPGKELRLLLTGDRNGVMPLRGEDRQRAERMVTRFSDAFKSEDTYKAQHDHGARFVYKRANRWGISISDQFDAEWDLASAIFWNYSVNAPSMARKLFIKHGHSPRSLIRALGKSRYGRWSADIRGGRYQRTRRYAMRLWSKDLFVGDKAICPKEFK